MLKLQKQGFGKATGNSRMMILPAKMSVWIKYVEIELLGRFQSFLYVRCCPSFSRNRGKRTIDCHIKLRTYSRQDGVLTQAASSRWGIETSKLAVLSNKNRFQPAHCRFLWGYAWGWKLATNNNLYVNSEWIWCYVFLLYHKKYRSIEPESIVQQAC